ncbi:MAG: hypothetical protein A2286_14490 [Gammaproteobacteria bacterium RIFOXYA12_FULL_61_12]|nr:MAG: hypothetical protein A2514_06010 [Gammaproteobacteria bacterium RIFOXYD12_FULL_61_37]OGT92771.1 MAG: hypothetical protein A2286_14490 [Gammaproteobacteria bacterium RIFOXYA12_FULL_61_12]
MSLEAVNLSQSFGGRSLYRGLNLRVNPGECWGILGLNGSGKTTLLHSLAGLRIPTGGQVLLEGKPVRETPRRHLARQIGVLLQQQSDEFPVSVLETALAGRFPHLGVWGATRACDLELARHWLERLGLSDFGERLASTLSGGERRRLAVATLMLQGPRIALLDEPDNHLDPARRKEILELLAGHFTTEGRSALMTLHDINLARRHCSHILMLNGEGDWLAGRGDELLTQARLEWLYRCPVTRIEGPSGPIFLPGY